MCILFLAVLKSQRLPLVIASNRDEFTSRDTINPTLGGCFPSLPHVISGKDIKAGGTWAATDTRNGRTATVLNVAPSEMMADAPSRGALPLSWIRAGAETSPRTFLEDLLSTESGDNRQYAGFSLIVTDVVYSDEQGQFTVSVFFGTNSFKQEKGRCHIQDLSSPGIYALTNDGVVLCDEVARSLESCKLFWPKARRGHSLLASIMNSIGTTYQENDGSQMIERLINDLMTTLLLSMQVDDEHSNSISAASKTSGQKNKLEDKMPDGQAAWEAHVSDARGSQSTQEVPIFLAWSQYATRISTVVVISTQQNQRSLRIHYADQSYGEFGPQARTTLGPFEVDRASESCEYSAAL